ncbi:MAG: hypothetical protein K2J64_03105, partial [Desulfovibrio sp.]|nr:hypothetical protein [Desulfovibrio sp.]
SPASRATASALLLAASEKNFLGRVLKYTPFGNFCLPCQQQKILFFRILPAPAPVFRFAPDGLKEVHQLYYQYIWHRKKTPAILTDDGRSASLAVKLGAHCRA